MKLNVILLLICCVSLHRVNCSLPNFTPATPLLQGDVSVKTNNELSRLPGLCRRLKRRRVTVLCNLEKFCWKRRSQMTQSGQVCRCPLGSRCSRFFVHSL